MEELLNLYRRKYKEIDRKYQDFCRLEHDLISQRQVLERELQVLQGSPASTFRDILGLETMIAGINTRLHYERPESTDSFVSKMIDIVIPEGPKHKKNLHLFYDRIGESYVADEVVSGNVCSVCHCQMLQISDSLHRCEKCGDVMESFETVSQTSGKGEKSNKYKRQEYFVEVIKKIQKTYNFKVLDTDMEILYQFFREVESNWYKVFPMQAFIAYQYLFRKGLELLGTYDVYLKKWKLSRSDENIKKNDGKWKKICEILRYEFIPTVS